MPKTYAIYNYITAGDNSAFFPNYYHHPPFNVDPKKNLFIRPFEDPVLNPNGEVNKIVYWDSEKQEIKLYEEQITYERDTNGQRTKNLAIKQTKTLMWYYNSVKDAPQELDEVNTKILTKTYVVGQVKDSQGVELPTSLQLKEWKRKCENQVHYMITKEVAGTLIDQYVFVLFDNLLDVIAKWKENPVSTVFADAIKNKMGGFPIDIPDPAEDPESGKTILLDIWDVVVNEEGNSLQKFLYKRITGEGLP